MALDLQDQVRYNRKSYWVLLYVFTNVADNSTTWTALIPNGLHTAQRLF